MPLGLRRQKEGGIRHSNEKIAWTKREPERVRLSTGKDYNINQIMVVSKMRKGKKLVLDLAFTGVDFCCASIVRSRLAEKLCRLLTALGIEAIFLKLDVYRSDAKIVSKIAI